MQTYGNYRLERVAYRVSFDTDTRMYRCEGLAFGEWTQVYREPVENDGIIQMDMWSTTMAGAVEKAIPYIEEKMRSLYSGEES